MARSGGMLEPTCASAGAGKQNAAYGSSAVDAAKAREVSWSDHPAAMQATRIAIVTHERQRMSRTVRTSLPCIASWCWPWFDEAFRICLNRPWKTRTKRLRIGSYPRSPWISPAIQQSGNLELRQQSVGRAREWSDGSTSASNKGVVKQSDSIGRSTGARANQLAMVDHSHRARVERPAFLGVCPLPPRCFSKVVHGCDW